MKRYGMIGLLIGAALGLQGSTPAQGQEDSRPRRQLQAECRFAPLGPAAVRLDVDYELQTTLDRSLSLRARARTAAGFDEEHFRSSIAPAEAGAQTAQIVLSFTGTAPVEVVDVWVELLVEGRDHPRASKAFEFRRTFPLDAEGASTPPDTSLAPPTPIAGGEDLEGVLRLIAQARAKEPPAEGEQEAPRVLRGWSVRKIAADTVEVCASCDTSHVSRGRVVVGAALLTRLPSAPDLAPVLMPDTRPAAALMPTDTDGWTGTLLLAYPHRLAARAAGVRVVVLDWDSRAVLDLEDVPHRMALAPAPEPGTEEQEQPTVAPGPETAPGEPEPGRPSIGPTAPEARANGAEELLKLPAADLGSRGSLAQPGDHRTGIIKLWAVRQLEHNLVEVQVLCKSPGEQGGTLTVTGALLSSLPVDPLSPPALFPGTASASATVELEDGQAPAVLCFPYLGKEEATVAGVRLVVTAPGQQGALDVLDTQRAMTLSQPQAGGNP